MPVQSKVPNGDILSIDIGGTNLKACLLSLAKKNHVNLKILDNIPNDKMPDMYNQSDIFVSPSLGF